MVLTTSHTISKSKTDEKIFNEIIDSLRDSEYFTEYTVDKHDRLHRKPRRNEAARTTTQKEKEEKTLAMAKVPISAINNKKSFFSSEALLNLIKRKKYKTFKNNSTKRKEKSGKTTNQGIIPAETSDVTTKLSRSRRKRRRNFTLQMQKRYVTPFEKLYSTTSKLPPKSFKDPYLSNLSHRIYFPMDEDKLGDEYALITNIPSTDMTYVIDTSQDFVGTAEIENLLAQIKERAILTISNEVPSVSEYITTAVTETTFETDPTLRHYFSRASTLKNLFSYYQKQKRNLNSTIGALETREDGSNFKSNVFSSACCLEDHLQKEIKELLRSIKCKLCKGISCVKSSTKNLLHEAQLAIHQATEPNTSSTKTDKSTTKTTPHVYNDTDLKITTENNPTARNARNITSKEERLIHQRERITDVPDQPTSTVDEDDYSMLKRFEHILSKAHENNVLKMLTKPHNVLSYKQNVDKVSKRNQETIEDLNLKENIRKLVDSYPIPDELEDNNDRSFGTSRKEDYDEDTEESNVGASTASTTSLEGLSNRLSYKEYVDGFKNYLNYVRETTSSNFSNLVRYQAHRHHKVEDIGKFILDKIPSTVPQVRKKRRFFDDSDGDDQDMSTKSDESWFKRHFYLFIDTGPPKKYHTAHTMTSKEARETTEHKSGRQTRASAVKEITKEESKAMLDNDIDEILKYLDNSVHSLPFPTWKPHGGLYINIYTLV